MKDTVSHYVPPHSPLTSTEPQVFSNNLTMPADVPSTLTSDEAADQPVPAVRLATERHESDGRFARR